MAATREERFEGLFRENYPAVRAYALRRTSGEGAQDAVAETRGSRNPIPATVPATRSFCVSRSAGFPSAAARR